MNKRKLLLLIAYIIIFLVTWNLLELAYSRLILDAAYEFSATDDLVCPLVLAVISWLLFVFRSSGKK